MERESGVVRQELVFIGIGHDESACTLAANLLLTDQERQAVRSLGRNCQTHFPHWNVTVTKPSHDCNNRPMKPSQWYLLITRSLRRFHCLYCNRLSTSNGHCIRVRVWITRRCRSSAVSQLPQVRFQESRVAGPGPNLVSTSTPPMVSRSSRTIVPLSAFRSTSRSGESPTSNRPPPASLPNWEAPFVRRMCCSKR